MARPNLRDLPEELVSNISLRLWSDDVQALRLTCKALEEKTLHEWATEYFTEKAFIISTDSLKVLLNIANSAKFRGYLRRMHIITAYFSDSAFTCGKTCPYGHCCGWQPTVRQREAWNFFIQDQKDLKSSEKDKQMLRETFQKLPVLCDLTLADSTSAIPLSVDIRSMRKVARLCGRSFQMPTDGKDDAEYFQMLSHTWTILTSAIATSGINTLTHFATNLGKGNLALCVPSDLRFSDAKTTGLRTAFSNLQSLRMNITARAPRSAPPQKSMSATGQLRLLKFASLLPPLRSLALDLDSKQSDNAIFSGLMQNLDLSKMTLLQLNTVTTDRATLTAVLKRLDSIQDLYLNFVDLAKGSWIPILKQLQGMVGSLEHLHLMYLLESSKKAYFLAQPDEDEQMAQGDDYTFDDMIGDFIDEVDTDEDLPPLETMDGEMVGGGTDLPSSTAPSRPTVEDETESSSLQDPFATSAQAASAAQSSLTQKPKAQLPKPGSPDYHASSDHKAPGNEDYPERGYYVCIRGKEEIGKQLKNFIREYNVGEHVSAEGPPGMGGMMGGMGGGMIGGAMTIPVGGPGGPPPNVGNFLNGLAASLGLPPMPGQNDGDGGGTGPGHGGHHGGGVATGATNGTTANATAGQANGAQNNHAPASAGAAAAPSAGADGVPSFADFMMDALPPPSFAGGHFAGGGADDEWDTEGGSSEFESEADE